MPNDDDATPAPAGATPTTTTTATRPAPPKWGDDFATIAEGRRKELRALHDAQVHWANTPNRDPRQSPFARDTSDDHPLTGVEVFYLAAYALAGPEGDLERAAQRLREAPWTSVEALHLEGATLIGAQLAGADLSGAQLAGADLSGAQLAGADLNRAQLAGADLSGAQLAGAYLSGAQLAGADLSGAQLAGAYLSGAQLAGADLSGAQLAGADLSGAQLAGADLRGAFFSVATDLTNATVADPEHGGIRVADVRWQDVNLAVVKEWPEDMLLGDERAARELVKKPLTRRRYSDEPLPKNATREQRREARERRRGELLDAWREAARANRQLAAVMRDQGMNDEADHFAYRGQLCQRQLYRYQGKRGRQLGSWLLDRISGYGYYPVRSLITYASVVLGFAVVYLILRESVHPALGPLDALVFSVTSFHGRGFSPGEIITLHNPLTVLAAGEAIIGLLIEITFIATFTQRFFGR